MRSRQKDLAKSIVCTFQRSLEIDRRPVSYSTCATILDVLVKVFKQPEDDSFTKTTIILDGL